MIICDLPHAPTAVYNVGPPSARQRNVSLASDAGPLLDVSWVAAIKFEPWHEISNNVAFRHV